MIYLIRTTDESQALMRDGALMSDPVREVCGRRYTAFGNLPGGLMPGINPGVEVMLAVDETEAEALREKLAAHIVAGSIDGDDRRARTQAKIDLMMGREPETPEPEAEAEQEENEPGDEPEPVEIYDEPPKRKRGRPRKYR